MKRNAMYEVARQWVEQKHGKQLQRKEINIAAELCYCYSAIDNAEDIRRNNLTLASYHGLYDIINTLLEGKTAYCFIKDIAEWCEKHGCTVKPGCVNYEIKL